MGFETETPKKNQSPDVLFLWFLALLTIMILGLFIALLFQKPSFNKPTFQINSAIVYLFNISSSSSSDSYLTTNWSLWFTAGANYWSPLMFEDVKVYVLLKSVVVSSTALKSFPLEYPDVKMFWVNLTSSGIPLNHTVVEAVNGERIKDGALTFASNITSRVTMNYGGSNNVVVTKHVSVLCEDLKIHFVNNDMSSPLVPTGEPFPFNCKSIVLHD
ncbi:hypothetical protein M5689_007000 [Euphorbia peplus]|nr:hypothetical protein M5689_007000 [Euphorbia peplus]